VTPTYRWDGRPVNAGWVTTFNQRAVVSEDRVTAIPSDFPLELAPLLGCAVTTGLGAITRDAAVTPGESVVVLGAGGVGLSVVQAAALVSAYPIVAVDLHENRLRLARQVGASHTVDAAGATAEEELRGLLGGEGADACIETSGDPRAIEQAIALTGGRGRVVLVGVPPHADAIALHTLQLHFGKQLIGSHGGQARPAEDIPRLIRLVQAGSLDLSLLVAERVPLADVNLAIERIRSGSAAGRILLEL
jgi:S-(hydroxymethyl)glutathione dehydrogenase/alcohol dehydrogenase